VDAHGDGAVPRGVVAHLHVVVGGRTDVVARLEAGFHATLRIRADADGDHFAGRQSLRQAVLFQTREVPRGPGRAEVTQHPVGPQVRTQAPDREVLGVDANAVVVRRSRGRTLGVVAHVRAVPGEAERTPRGLAGAVTGGDVPAFHVDFGKVLQAEVVLVDGAQRVAGQATFRQHVAEALVAFDEALVQDQGHARTRDRVL